MRKKVNRALLLKKLHISWSKAFLRLLPLGGFSSDNRVKIFHVGDDAFIAIIDAFRNAHDSIYVETYSLASDRVGLWLRETLIEARKRGVIVTILYDHVGSTGLTNAFLKPMIACGIKVLAFNPIWPWRRRGPLLFRDHRKIITVDEKLAFCGGMNISADYAGPIYGNNRFRDSLALIEGPAAKDLLAITRESIAEAEFEKEPDAVKETILSANKQLSITQLFQGLFKSKTNINVAQVNKEALVQVLRSNMRRNVTHIQRSMEESVNRAVSYCYFTTPYFLPLDGLRKAIINAKRRGVDVRILTAGLSDVPLMRYASRHVYKGLLQENIRIYEMTKKTLHAKIATIDGIYASIGSYNLDHWSARRNLEVSLSIIDQDISLDLKKQFKEDVSLSIEIKRVEFLSRSLLRRFLCWMAYVILRL
jgi:cardiolipin synthase